LVAIYVSTEKKEEKFRIENLPKSNTKDRTFGVGCTQVTSRGMQGQHLISLACITRDESYGHLTGAVWGRYCHTIQE